MAIEVLVYIYAYLSICVIIFDLLYMVRTRYNVWSMPRQTDRFQSLVTAQAATAVWSGSPRIYSTEQMVRMLRRPSSLIAFMQAFEALRKAGPAQLDAYLSGICPVFLGLAHAYSRKKPELQAYFSYAVCTLRFGGLPACAGSCRKLGTALLPLLRSESVYVRENTCKAVLSLGDSTLAMHALAILNEDPARANGKLLSENLLRFAGYHAALSGLLLRKFDTFAPPLQVVLIDYLRLLPVHAFDQHASLKPLFERLIDPKSNKEVRLALVRYFRRYAYPDAHTVLLQMVEDPETHGWEFSAVAASSLVKYPGEVTIAALMRAASSPNWYVRFNAAESLIDLGMDCSEQLLANMDAFARGMLRYRSDIYKHKQKGRFST